MQFARLLAHLLIIAGLGLCATDQAAAETRRALVIGIDRYDQGLTPEDLALAKANGRRVWPNLRGSVNDATAIREILTRRFSFQEADVVLLTDESATRSRIISEFEHHLINQSQPGDHIVLFYAGHGSRVRNSNSAELDKKDETIVPSDANRGDGRKTIMDIRDKEWDRLFTRALDKGLRLTAIFDSCHSGSISRGVTLHSTRVRFLEEDERDVALLVGPEPSAHLPGQEPEKRDGALIISAAQEDQFASEAAIRNGEKKEWHGAFTLALLDALQQLPAAAAERVFDRVTAKLKAMGLRQDPILAGPQARRHAPLFGNAPLDGPRELHLNVVHADGADDIELQGGLALGLRPGTELVPTHAAGATPVRLRITQVRDLLRSQAAVIQGNWKSIRSGDEFEVVRWGSLPELTIKVYIPPPTSDETAILSFAAALRQQLAGAGVMWVEDPTEQPITHLLAWTDNQWTLTGPTGPGVPLGLLPRAGTVLSSLPHDKTTVRLFMNLPPSAMLRNALVPLGKGGEGRAELTQDMEDADYVLVGRPLGPRSEHAWVLRTFAPSGARPLQPPTLPLPPRTAWGTVKTLRSPCADGGLKACLPQLAKLYHWLNVESPADDRRFPYRLGFTPLTPVSASRADHLSEGTYQLMLESDEETIAALQANWGIQARYVYVFVIDQDGRSTLLFPNDASKERAHLLPRLGTPAPSVKDLAHVPMGDSAVINVHAPFGSDTYVMLSSSREIPRIKELVETDAVDSSARRMRGQTDWSISRRFMLSMPGSR